MIHSKEMVRKQRETYIKEAEKYNKNKGEKGNALKKLSSKYNKRKVSERDKRAETKS